MDRLAELYEKHDEKAAKIKSVVVPQRNDASDLSEGEGLTTDGEDGTSRRDLMLQAQEKASKELLEELKSERDDLVAEFD